MARFSEISARHTRLVLAVALAIAFPAIEAARAERWPIRSFGVEDGLPSGEILSIDRDPLGFLWLGTVSGLARYDGHRFVSWRTGLELPAAAVNGVTWAGGRHWIATDAGLLRSTGSPDRPFEPIPDSWLGRAEIHMVWTDPEGAVWVGADTSLLRIDPRSAEEPSPVDLSDLPVRGPIFDAAADGRGNLWFAATDGILRRTETDWVAYPLGESRESAVVSLAPARDGCLWLVTGRQLVGFRPDLRPASPVAVSLQARSPAPQPGTACPEEPGESWIAGAAQGLPQVYWDGDVLEDRNGILWVTTTEGLARGGPGGWKLLSADQGFPAREVRRLLEDAAGNLWAATKYHGARVLLANGFRTWTARDGLAGGESEFAVKSLVEDPDGSLLAITGVEGGGRFLERLDGESWHTIRPRLPAGFVRVSWGLDQLLLVDSVGSWWLGTNEGLLRWDPPVTAEAVEERLPEAAYTVEDGLGGPEVVSLFEDGHGDVWAGTSGGTHHLTRWVRAEDRFERFGSDAGIPAGAGPVFELVEDLGGTLWIAPYRGGILRRNGDGFALLGPEAGVPPGRITDLHVDALGRLWAASRQGGLVVCEDPEAEAIRCRPVEEPPGREAVEAIAGDGRTALWLGTDDGLLRWEPGTSIAERFGNPDGLAGSRVLVLHVGSDGDVWAGTTGGISRLSNGPRRLLPGSPLFTHVGLDGRSLDIAVRGQERRDLGTLAAGNHRIEVRVAAPSGALEPAGRLEWRLGTGDWTEVDPRGELRLAGLGPGRHRLEVRLAPRTTEAEAGGISPASATLDFRIRSPFWRRPEFLLALLGAAIGGLTLRHRGRLRRILEIEAVRSRVAADLHDDLGATLSRISLQSELARRDRGIREDLLRQIGESAREGLEAMRDLVWTLDPHQDDLAGLFSRLRDVGGRLLEPLDVTLAVTVDPEVESREIEGEARRHLFLILKEAITNIAKHAGATRVTVRAEPFRGRVRVLVEDDGRGMEPDSAESVGRGLANMRKRALDLGGTIAWSRTVPTGTRIELVLPPSAIAGEVPDHAMGGGDRES